MFRKILFATLLHTFLFAQVIISSKIDTTIATVGDQINLNVLVTYENENTSITFPNINDELQNFSVIARKSTKPEKTSTGFQQDFDFKIAVFDTGMIEIPSLTLAINGKHYADTKTSKHAVNVISILPPEEQVEPKDIKPPFPLPTIIPWDIILFVLIILIISILWFIFYKKWKYDHPRITFDEKYTEPPHIIALRKLKEVTNFPFSNESEIIATYTQISHIFREYLEGRYFVRALEMPTRDIMESLSILDIDNTIKMQSINTLQKLDIIKFAKQLPEISEKDNIIGTTENIINQTRIDNFLSQRSGLTEVKENLGK